jgi:anaerobic selenocysteine-containing dehydrogenase
MVDVVHDPDRVLRPLRRSGGPGQFEQVGWDDALDDVAQRLASVVERHGGDSVANYIGNPASFGSMHPAYMNGFLRALGSARKFNSLHTDTGAKNLTMELCPTLKVHPADAMRLSLADACAAIVTSGDNRICVAVEVTEDVAPGSVCYPHGLGP